MKHGLIIQPAYDKRDTDPKKNFGIHGAELRIHVINEIGAVSFCLYTNWHLASVKIKCGPEYCHQKPLPADLGYHHFVEPADADDWSGFDKCELHPENGPCWYDGSSLNADPAFDYLVEHGLDKFYEHLEGVHAEFFAEVAT